MTKHIYKTLPNNILIVEYEESHAKSLAKMWNDSSEFWSGETTVYTADSIKSEVEKQGNINAYLALTKHDEVIGFCNLCPSNKDEHSLYISLLNVHPDYHGKSIGKALINLAIERTIELGKARLDLYTWSGNTEAMPLYKKMGFFWEENVDYTHLTNFIPTVVTHALFEDFFANDPWHELSNRAIHSKPCGIKVNTFELFEYSFQKGNDQLKIGFEKSGKHVRMIETNDYKIEFLAHKHKLAFGLSYPATFHIENKSGKQLDIGIQGKHDENIAFDYQFTGQISGTVQEEATFFVGKVKDLQGEDKVHPSVLADVTINGKTIAFGLGINTQFPLENEFLTPTQLCRVGAKERVYVNIKNLLLEDATIRFVLPRNDKVQFSERDITLEVPAESYGSVGLDAQILSDGHVALPIAYQITPKKGQPFVYEKELHLALQGFATKYYYEDDKAYVIANGPWALEMDKNENCGTIKHLIQGDKGELINPELGKPYKDEFATIKPTVVIGHEVDGEMVLTYEWHSKAFEGIIVTQTTKLSASGRVAQKYAVKNVATTAKHLMLKMPYYTNCLGKQSVFAKEGQLTTNRGSMLTGAEAVEEKAFTENWIFEQHVSTGLCWPKDFKADMAWGGYIELEKDFGQISAGQVGETEEMEFIFDLFDHVTQFRDYVLGKYSDQQGQIKGFVELQTPSENPFIQDTTFSLALINHRNSILKGQFTLSSVDDLFEAQCQENKAEEVIRKHHFNVQFKKRPNDGIGRLRLNLNFEGYAHTYHKAVFFPKGSVRCHQENHVFTVKNDQFSFKADPTYSDGVFSLLYLDEGEEREWLMHQYPEHAPNAYWNPFYGGIQFRPDKLDERRILKEEKTATFIQIKDNFNNLWTGIKITVEVKVCEEAKGIHYENYFVTLPGLPLLCHFSNILNNTGAFKKLGFHTESFPSGAKALTENKLAYMANGQDQRLLHMGVVRHYEHHKSPLITVSSNRSEKLYVYRDKNDAVGSVVSSSNEFIQLYKHYQIKLAHKDKHQTPPMFMILTKDGLVDSQLRDLGKIRFKQEEETS